MARQTRTPADISQVNDDFDVYFPVISDASLDLQDRTAYLTTDPEVNLSAVNIAFLKDYTKFRGLWSNAPVSRGQPISYAEDDIVWAGGNFYYLAPGGTATVDPTADDGSNWQVLSSDILGVRLFDSTVQYTAGNLVYRGGTGTDAGDLFVFINATPTANTTLPTGTAVSNDNWRAVGGGGLTVGMHDGIRTILVSDDLTVTVNAMDDSEVTVGTRDGLSGLPETLPAAATEAMTYHLHIAANGDVTWQANPIEDTTYDLVVQNNDDDNAANIALVPSEGDTDIVTITAGGDLMLTNTTSGITISYDDPVELGGLAWDATKTYAAGDVVSFRTGTSPYRLYASLQGTNLNQTPPESTGDDAFWQEIDIARLRDIDNVNITNDPTNGQLLSWNTSESAWEPFTLSNASATADGLMSMEDFSKLARVPDPNTATTAGHYELQVTIDPMTMAATYTWVSAEVAPQETSFTVSNGETGDDEESFTVTHENGLTLASGTNTNLVYSETNRSITFDSTDTNTTYDLRTAMNAQQGEVELFDGTETDVITFAGDGATTVSSDGSNIVTISSTDNNTTYDLRTAENAQQGEVELFDGTSTDVVTFAGSGATTVSSDGSNIVTISSTDNNDNTEYTFTDGAGTDLYSFEVTPSDTNSAQTVSVQGPRFDREGDSTNFDSADTEIHGVTFPNNHTIEFHGPSQNGTRQTRMFSITAGSDGNIAPGADGQVLRTVLNAQNMPETQWEMLDPVNLDLSSTDDVANIVGLTAMDGNFVRVPLDSLGEDRNLIFDETMEATRTLVRYQDADSSVAPHRVRTAEITNTGDFVINLVTFNPTATRTALRSPNWDQTFASANPNPEILTIANPADLNEMGDPFIENVNFLTTGGLGVISGIGDPVYSVDPRVVGGTFNVDLSGTTDLYAGMVATTVASLGGTVRFTVQYLDNEGNITDVATDNAAPANTTQISFSYLAPATTYRWDTLPRISFLESHSSGTTRTTIANTSNVADNTSLAYTDPTVGSYSATASLSGSTYARGVSGLVIHKDSPSTSFPQFTATPTFVQPAETGNQNTATIAGSAGSATLSQGSYNYPSFYIFTDSVNTVPTVGDIIDGSGFDGDATLANGATSSSKTLTDRTITVTGTDPQAFWWGFRTAGGGTPTRFEIFTGGAFQPLNTTTGNTVGLRPDALPDASYQAEDYTLVGFVLQPGDNRIRIS